jgi:hypothetical protein
MKLLTEEQTFQIKIDFNKLETLVTKAKAMLRQENYYQLACSLRDISFKAEDIKQDILDIIS